MEPREADADFDHPLNRHSLVTERVLRGGDEREIKGLYVELGQDFWESTSSGRLTDVPVLSAPETRPVVVGALESVCGLILDAGCGPNPAVAIDLARDPNRTVVVVDIGLGMVRTARGIAAKHDTLLLGVAADLELLPFRTGAFDGLVCDDTIEHLPNDQAGISELARVLSCDGRGLLATPNRHSAAVLHARMRDRSAGRKKPAREYFVAASHLREYTWSEFEGAARAHFIIECRRPVGWREGRKRKMITRLLRWPGGRYVCQTLVLQCRPRRAPVGRSEASGKYGE